jgi:F-type H+-transporting ATPase subunit epsilon
MASSAILAVNLVTPKGVVAHTDADSVQAPGELGEFELLPGHVPMLSALKAGVLSIGTKSRARYAVSTGYLRVDPTGAVEILVEQAQSRDEIDADAAKKDLATAEAELGKWGDKPHDAEYTSLVTKQDWAKARLDVLSH